MEIELANALEIEKILVLPDGTRERFLMTICEPYVNEHGDWEALVHCPCVKALDKPRQTRGMSREQVMALGVRMVVICHGGEPQLEDEDGRPYPFPKPEDLDPEWVELEPKYRAL